MNPLAPPGGSPKSAQAGGTPTAASTQPTAAPMGDVNDPNSPAYAAYYNSQPATTQAYLHAPGSAGANRVAAEQADAAAHPGMYADFGPSPQGSSPNPLARPASTPAPASTPNPLARPPVTPAVPAAAPPPATPNPLGAPPVAVPKGVPPETPAATPAAPNPLGAPVAAPVTTTPNPLAAPTVTPAAPSPFAASGAGRSYYTSPEYAPGSSTDMVTNALMRRYRYGGY